MLLMQTHISLQVKHRFKEYPLNANAHEEILAQSYELIGNLQGWDVNLTFKRS